MLKQQRTILSAVLWLAASSVHAATVFRCQSEDGHLTYTLHGCPAASEQQIQNAFNPNPGGDQITPMANPDRERTTSTRRSDPVIVGSKQDGCGNLLSSSEKRTAVIRQQIRNGMNQGDVESTLGRPDKITSNNEETRYHYADRAGNRRQVTFDENGCVKGKR